ncbi:MAG: hypothetical protein NXY59_07045 [Aigarchaeota archaeon]|nr:hypothetical protein [Candidatus Pelearchaeum maunauluense]
MKEGYASILAASLVSVAVIAVGFLVLSWQQCQYTTTLVEDAALRRDGVVLISSVGKCGSLEKPTITYKRAGEYLILTYSEPANNICYRHIIESVKTQEGDTPLIRIELRLVETSEACVMCVGYITTTLTIGPLPEGARVYVNGLLAAA